MPDMPGCPRIWLPVWPGHLCTHNWVVNKINWMDTAQIKSYKITGNFFLDRGKLLDFTNNTFKLHEYPIFHQSFGKKKQDQFMKGPKLLDCVAKLSFTRHVLFQEKVPQQFQQGFSRSERLSWLIAILEMAVTNGWRLGGGDAAALSQPLLVLSVNTGNCH